MIERIAKAVSKVPGIGRVQAITRPEGKPLKYSTIPAQFSMGSTMQKLNRSYLEDRMADMIVQGNMMQDTINTMTQMIGLMEQMSANMHNMVTRMDQTARTCTNCGITSPISTTSSARFATICTGSRTAMTSRSVRPCARSSTALDGVDTMTDDIQRLLPDMHKLDALMPQMVQMMGPTVESMKRMRVMMLTMQATQSGQQEQMKAMDQNSTAMGDAFNDAHNDDTFYLPPEIFDNADFKRGMKNFISPRRPRGAVHHLPRGRPAVRRRHQAHRRHQDRRVRGHQGHAIGGVAGLPRRYRLGVQGHARQGNKYDLLIAGVAALTLIFIIMLLITRAIVAAAVIVGTVVVSLGASFGMSVLLWQHLLGMDLQFMVMAMAVIILLAVGADYNLLLVARMKEELPAGINTGIIRAMGGSGSVVTAAGMVFAFTMMSMSVSAMVVIAQVGTTIGLGLLFDTLVDPGVHDAGDRSAVGPMVLVAAGGAAAAGAGASDIESALRARNRKI